MPRKVRRKRTEPGKQVTISDIARTLGVSAMTVSRVLNGHPSVSAETRERVQQKIKELRYQPNRWARSLVTRRSQLIGLVVPDISHSFFAEITRGIQESIEAKDYNLILCNSGRNPETELRELHALVSSRVDGLIVASEQPEEHFEYFQELLGRKIPLVFVDRFFRGLPATRLVTDDFEVGSLATRHVIELGHRRIGYL